MIKADIIRKTLNKPNNSSEKIVAVAMSILILTSALLTIGLPTTNAALVYPTYAFLIVEPNPVGVGQTVNAFMFLNLLPPAAQGVITWGNYTLSITTPDGTTKTLGPLQSDAAASTYVVYTPDVIGNYTLRFSFLGYTAPNGDYYQPSVSREVTVTVQNEPIPSWSETPLPTEYWTRPINEQNTAWSIISGDWQGTNVRGNAFNGNTTAPNSSHVLWRSPLQAGGLVGGQFGTLQYYTGFPYEQVFSQPIVLDGILYYNAPMANRYGFTAVDLSTGKTLWTQNGTTGQKITAGQIWDFRTVNQYGAFVYLWDTSTTTWSMYNAYTGDWVLNFANAMATTSNIRLGPNGELLYYNLDATANRLIVWNSTLCMINNGLIQSWMKLLPIPGSAAGPALYRPAAGTYNWTGGIQYNVTVSAIPRQSIVGIDSGVIFASVTNPGLRTDIGYDATTGQQLWTANRTLILGATTFNALGPMGDGVYLVWSAEELSWYAYSLQTGQQLWGPSKALGGDDWAFYSNAILGASRIIAYGKLYTESYDGVLRCYDLKTGQTDWTYSTDSRVIGGIFAADNKIYVNTGEIGDSPTTHPGYQLFCINASTGQEVWNVNGWYWSPVAAEGSVVAFNNYDGEIYCYGKGPTQTTVTTPQASIELGHSLVISGTVTDISAGTTDTEQAARFPNGVPAVSDDNMSAWMAYVYMQQPRPTNTIGVPVTLSVIDSNGNYRQIGYTTSDSNGMFSFQWTPDIPGKYTVIATFTGSQSYYRSSSETAFAVDPAAPTASPYPVTVLPPTETYITAAAIAIIIAVAIVGIVMIMMLRKRP